MPENPGNAATSKMYRIGAVGEIIASEATSERCLGGKALAACAASQAVIEDLSQAVIQEGAIEGVNWLICTWLRKECTECPLSCVPAVPYKGSEPIVKLSYQRHQLAFEDAI